MFARHAVPIRTAGRLLVAIWSFRSIMFRGCALGVHCVAVTCTHVTVCAWSVPVWVGHMKDRLHVRKSSREIMIHRGAFRRHKARDDTPDAERPVK